MSTPTSIMAGRPTSALHPAVRGRVLRDAELVSAQLGEQRTKWADGFTRRSFLAGCGMAATATLGAQLVTTRRAFAAPGSGNGKVMIVVFLRGGFDGLSAVVPGADRDYQAARPTLAIPQGSLLPLDSRFGLHPRLGALHPYWKDGRLGVVHAVAAPFASRSHFQAMDVVERGAQAGSVTTGWLERALQQAGPGTTFRAVSEGHTPPASTVGADGLVTMLGIDSLQLNDESPEIIDALHALYTGLSHPLEEHTDRTLSTLDEAKLIQQSDPRPAPGARYPEGDFSVALADLARLIKNGSGLRVATVDLGGWDVHTVAGSVTGRLPDHFGMLADTLAAFCTDLGPALSNVTVTVMSEFGRRVEENGSDGTDHGRGGAMLLLGGPVRGGQVHGRWPGLAPAALEDGDLAIANDYRDVLGEVTLKTLGLGSISTIFPDHAYRPLGVMR